MDQPLGQAVGNALEVAEAIEVLKGGGPADLKELCLHLGAVTLESVGLAGDAAQARHKVKAALTSGAALLKFKEIVIAQGGDPQVIDNPLALPQANHHLILRLPASASAGWLKAISTKEIGVIARELSKSEKGGSHPNAAAGVLMHVQVGSHVHAGDRLATIYGDSAQSCSSVAGSLQKAFLVSESPVRKPKLILDDIV
jgi:thymidine phosphorylase